MTNQDGNGAVRSAGSASGAREGVTEANRDRMRCHRDGDTCAWAGCPNQFDDRPSTGCFLVGARKDDA